MAGQRGGMRAGNEITLVFLCGLLGACSRPPVLPPADAPATAAHEEPDQPPLLQFAGRGEVRQVGRPAAPPIAVELARTEPERAQGLMFRRSLAGDRGMLFFMPYDNDWIFYMRNTYVPLDMVFIDADWTVAGVLDNVAPLTETHRSVGKPSRYVLELAAHEAAHRGISGGSRLSFVLLPDLPALAPR